MSYRIHPTVDMEVFNQYVQREEQLISNEIQNCNNSNSYTLNSFTNLCERVNNFTYLLNSLDKTSSLPHKIFHTQRNQFPYYHYTSDLEFVRNAYENRLTHPLTLENIKHNINTLNTFLGKHDFNSEVANHYMPLYVDLLKSKTYYNPQLGGNVVATQPVPTNIINAAPVKQTSYNPHLGGNVAPANPKRH